MTIQQQAANMINTLPDDEVKLIIEMIKRMTKNVEIERDSIVNIKSETKADGARRKIGFISDAFVSIAPDFDETPECMKEYM